MLLHRSIYRVVHGQRESPIFCDTLALLFLHVPCTFPGQFGPHRPCESVVNESSKYGLRNHPCIGIVTHVVLATQLL